MKAFPTDQLVVSDMGQVRAVSPLQDGMDLRDYFAAKALTGLLTEATTDYKDISIAELAYGLADAMMKVREQ